MTTFQPSVSGPSYDQKGNQLHNPANGGLLASNVPTGAANTVVSNTPGRVCRVLVTTAGAGTGNVLFFDNASTNTGLVVAIVPATIAIGTYYTFDIPVANGIVVQNVASGPVLTVSYA